MAYQISPLSFFYRIQVEGKKKKGVQVWKKTHYIIVLAI